MIDAHVHLFPDPGMGRAWQEVVGFTAERDGTVDDLIGRMAVAGIERSIVLLFPRSTQRLAALRAAAGPEVGDEALRSQVASEIRALNRWGCGLTRADPRFLTFVGVNPRFMTSDEIVAELRIGAASGARGMKLIPAAMQVYPDDPALFPAYETCVELGLPVLSQSGTGGAAVPGPRGPYGRPAAFDAVLAAFPTLRLDLAHLGRGLDDELVELFDRHPGVVGDTSLRLGSPHDPEPWDPAPIRALIRRLGVDRVLFGTNYPIIDPVEYRRRFDALDLTSAEAAAIGSDNALRFLGE